MFGIIGAQNRRDRGGGPKRAQLCVMPCLWRQHGGSRAPVLLFAAMRVRRPGAAARRNRRRKSCTSFSQFAKRSSLFSLKFGFDFSVTLVGEAAGAFSLMPTCSFECSAARRRYPLSFTNDIVYNISLVACGCKRRHSCRMIF